MTTTTLLTPDAASLDLIVSRAGSLYTLPAVAADVLQLTNHPKVDVRALKKTRLVALTEMRKQKPLKHMVTLRPGNRLSITPVTEAQWKHITTRLL